MRWASAILITPLLAFSANANTTSAVFTGTFTNKLTDFAGAPTNSTCTNFLDFNLGNTTLGCIPLSVQKFNPSLGTLTSVEIQLGWSGTTSLQVTATGGSPATGHIDTNILLHLSDALNAPDSLIQSGFFGGISDELDIGCHAISGCYGGVPVFIASGFSNLPSGNTASIGPLTNTFTQDQTFNAGSVLSEFTGLGTVPMYAATETKTTITFTSGNGLSAQTTDVSVSGQVIYTYTPTATPEPGTLGLLGTSLAGMAFALRKRLRRG
jgi:PEP-CTERM motif